ncbi:nucleoside phosphorylase [Bradyrhizobium sp. GCM10028915]|uniref:nucleoside phosphorylase n=1 Tax=Bradyrhizobium sp. GCM10028915 TaxID=3273385 RepID=UPI00361FE194
MRNPPILANKNSAAASVFEPKALFREARRQKQLEFKSVPEVCVLDPDGDIVRRLRRDGRARRAEDWPCYHTDLYTFDLDGGRQIGIVGCAVGAPFAVLVAEELFASECKLLISITSAGQIKAVGTPPYFVIIDRALRDEGTSYHYAEPAEFAHAERQLLATMARAAEDAGLNVIIGDSWTTDAPFRETEHAIAQARDRGILAVEMEAAALYAFAEAKQAKILCIAHVTNTMGIGEQDFEKGEADGTADALRLIEVLVNA